MRAAGLRACAWLGAGPTAGMGTRAPAMALPGISYGRCWGWCPGCVGYEVTGPPGAVGPAQGVWRRTLRCNICPGKLLCDSGPSSHSVNGGRRAPTTSEPLPRLAHQVFLSVTICLFSNDIVAVLGLPQSGLRGSQRVCGRGHRPVVWTVTGSLLALGPPMLRART